MFYKERPIKKRLEQRCRLLGKHPNPVTDWNSINFKYYLIQSLWKWGEKVLKPEWPLSHPKFWKKRKIIKTIKNWTLKA